MEATGKKTKDRRQKEGKEESTDRQGSILQRLTMLLVVAAGCSAPSRSASTEPSTNHVSTVKTMTPRPVPIDQRCDILLESQGTPLPGDALYSALSSIETILSVCELEPTILRLAVEIPPEVSIENKENVTRVQSRKEAERLAVGGLVTTFTGLAIVDRKLWCTQVHFGPSKGAIRTTTWLLSRVEQEKICLKRDSVYISGSPRTRYIAMHSPRGNLGGPIKDSHEGPGQIRAASKAKHFDQVRIVQVSRNRSLATLDVNAQLLVIPGSHRV